MAAPNEPLSRDELVGFVRARLERTRDQDSRAVLLAVGQHLRRPDYAGLSGRATVDLLASNRWKLEHNLSPGQLRALSEVVNQLDSVVDDPDRARRFVEAGAARAAQGRPTAATPQPARDGARADLVDRVTGSAAGSVVVHTSQSPGTPLRYRSGPAKSELSGFQNFGDGVDNPSSRPSKELQDAWAEAGPTMYEGVAFVPATEPAYRSEEYVTKRRLFGPAETATRQVQDGRRAKMVDGPRGPEPGVRFGYAFDPHQHGGSPNGLPGYRDPASGRHGNLLAVEAVLPASVAASLQTAIERDPAYARTVVEQLVLRNGGLDPAAWAGNVPSGLPMQPPYREVPVTKPLHLVTRGEGGKVAVRPLQQTAGRSNGKDFGEFVQKFTATGAGQGRSSGQQTGGDGARSYRHDREQPSGRSGGRG
ncbi:hypothetical protein [Kribbella flavida]|uniref:hypothetical protein n=1 Tax=Kribbella flavida TaxID=182640 RepID=UPI00019BD965|nr:hypothetical protein [Kribbella flavida]